MICKNCGQRLKSKHNVCPVCGTASDEKKGNGFYDILSIKDDKTDTDNAIQSDEHLHQECLRYVSYESRKIRNCLKCIFYIQAVMMIVLSVFMALLIGVKSDMREQSKKIESINNRTENIEADKAEIIESIKGIANNAENSKTEENETRSEEKYDSNGDFEYRR